MVTHGIRMFSNMSLFKVLHMIYFTILLSYLLYCSKNAFDKYYSEPTVTNIYKTYGDTENGIEFPRITLCPDEFEKKSLKYCKSDKHEYLSRLQDCLNYDKNFDFMRFYNTSYYRNIIPLINVSYRNSFSSQVKSLDYMQGS